MGYCTGMGYRQGWEGVFYLHAASAADPKDTKVVEALGAPRV